MKNIRLIKSGFFAATFAVVFSLTFSSCKKEKDVKPTISQIAVSLDGFSQLEAAAIKGNLAVALSNKNPTSGSEGNYTVFAPTNEAFAKIGLVNPQDLNALQTPFLTNVLLYHTNNGNTKDAMLTGNASVPSLLGPTKRIVMRGNEKFINGSKIIATDVKADNGTVQVIDRVLLASGADIANTAIFFAQGNGFVNPELSFLVEAVVYCDLVGALSDANANYTVFAPTNQAFKDLGKLLGVAIDKPADIRKIDKATVTQVLLTHVFNLSGGAKFTSEMYPGQLTALNGQKVTLGDYNKGVLSVKGAGNAVAANMVIPDVQTTNGIVHVIDRVLLP